MTKTVTQLQAEIYELKAHLQQEERLNGMGAQRELKLITERDALKAELTIERERSARLVEALMEIEKTCPIIEEMSDVQLIKADGDDFLFRSTNRRRKIARQALLDTKQDSAGRAEKDLESFMEELRKKPLNNPDNT